MGRMLLVGVEIGQASKHHHRADIPGVGVFNLIDPHREPHQARNLVPHGFNGGHHHLGLLMPLAHTAAIDAPAHHMHQFTLGGLVVHGVRFR